MKIIIKNFVNTKTWSNQELANYLKSLLGDPKDADTKIKLTSDILESISSKYDIKKSEIVGSTFKDLYKLLKEVPERVNSSDIPVSDKSVDDIMKLSVETLTYSDMKKLIGEQFYNDSIHKEVKKFLDTYYVDQFGKLINNKNFITYLLSQYIYNPKDKKLYDIDEDRESGKLNSILYHAHLEYKGTESPFNYIATNHFSKSQIITILINFCKYSLKYKSGNSTNYWKYRTLSILAEDLINNSKLNKGEFDKINELAMAANMPPVGVNTVAVSNKGFNKFNWNKLNFETISSCFYNPNLDKDTFDRICCVAEIAYEQFTGVRNYNIKVDKNTAYKLNEWDPHIIIMHYNGTDWARSNISGLKKFYPEIDWDKELQSKFSYMYKNYIKWEDNAIKQLNN